MKKKPELILLLGPAGCGKTQYCTESFEDVLQQSENPLDDHLLFILPTAEHRARTIDLILRRGFPGFFQRRITTFDRALKEFLKLGGIRFATDVTRRMILKEIFGRLEFQYFDSAKRTNGFINLIAHTLVELKENLIRPGELQKKLSGIKKEFPEFGLKYDDLCLVYEAYEKELIARGLTDQRDSLRLLEEGLSRGEFAAPELSHVWIDGFSDFSKLQLAFIEFLTRHADRITVTLTLDQDPLRAPLFGLVSETQAALEDIGFKTEWMESQNHRAQTDGLRILERNLFRKNAVASPAPSDGCIQIFEATGLVGEMEMIAREIKKLVRVHHYNFSDVAVLFRTTNPYLQVIHSVFRKFEIPFEIHERTRLKTTPIARTLGSFLEIFLNGWNRKDIFNFLKSSYVKLNASTYQEISDLELSVLKKGIFKDRAYWLKTFPDSEPLKQIAQCEDEFLKLKNAAQFSAWAKKMISSFGLLNLPDNMEEKTRLDRESLRRIFSLLEELTQKNPGASEPVTSLAEQLLSLMEVDLFSMHSRDKNKVQIYNVSLARQKEYKAVFLAGLLERQFPIQVREDPVFSDAERRTLNQKGQLLKEALPRQAFERYLFYLAATRTREHLILTFPRFDLEGREALPSFYVDEVRSLFSGDLPSKKQYIADVLPDWNEIGTIEEAETLVVRDLWQIPLRALRLVEPGAAERQEDEDHHLSFAVYNYLIQNPDFRNLIRRLLVPIEGLITDEHIKPYFKRDVWNSTVLEEYADCPFRFFTDRILKLETQIEGVDIKRRGTILHDVLEHFFTFQRDAKKQISFAEAKKFCLSKFDELWEEEPLGGDRFYKIELERRKMQEILLQILKLELIDEKPPLSGLRPAHFEFEFLDVVLKGKKRDIQLRGKIDRIDVDPEGKYALVIDYKYGKTFKPAALGKGTMLQLPLYLIAVRDKLKLKPLGGHLYSLVRASSSGFHHKDNLAKAGIATRKENHFSEQQFEAMLEQSVAYAEKFVGEIERGEIPVRPRECVSYCEYSTICRIEKWRLKHIYKEIEEADQKPASV